jgi:hypothetical protein
METLAFKNHPFFVPPGKNVSDQTIEADVFAIDISIEHGVCQLRRFPNVHRDVACEPDESGVCIHQATLGTIGSPKRRPEVGGRPLVGTVHPQLRSHKRSGEWTGLKAQKGQHTLRALWKTDFATHRHGLEALEQLKAHTSQ